MMSIEVDKESLPIHSSMNDIIWWILIGICCGYTVGTLAGMLIWN